MSRLITFRGLLVLNNTAITLMEKGLFLDSKRALQRALSALEQEFFTREDRPREDEELGPQDANHHRHHDAPTALLRRELPSPMESINSCLLVATRRLIQVTAAAALPPEAEDVPSTEVSNEIIIEPRLVTTPYLCFTLSSMYADIFLDTNDDFLHRILSALMQNDPGRPVNHVNIDANSVQIASRLEFQQLLGMVIPIRIETEDYDTAVPADWIAQTIIAAVLLYNLGVVFLRERTVSSSNRINHGSLHLVSQCFQWAKSTLDEFRTLLYRFVLVEQGMEEFRHSFYFFLTNCASQLEILLLQILLLVSTLQQQQPSSAHQQEEMLTNHSSLVSLLDLILLERSHWHQVVSGTRNGAGAA